MWFSIRISSIKIDPRKGEKKTTQADISIYQIGKTIKDLPEEKEDMPQQKVPKIRQFSNWFLLNP